MSGSELVEILSQVAKSPGTCDHKDIQLAVSFYTEFLRQLELFRTVQGREPNGWMVYSILEQLSFILQNESR